MDPNQQQLLLTGGAKDSTYVDEVFNTKVYVGNQTERTITTGIDLAGEGGLLWFKNCDNANQANYLNDTTTLPQTSSPWYSYPMFSNSSGARGPSANGLKSFNSDGFTIQTDTHCNGNGNKQVAWSFRKAPGFFDIVQYDGDSTTRDIAHNLGCVPGVIMIKRTDQTGHWWVYHKDCGRASTDWAKVLRLNEVDGQSDAYCLGSDQHQNASTFRVGNDNSMNTTGGSYVAYLFAGGRSTAATAPSVEFNGSDAALTIAATNDFDFGTGDFTVEFWCYADQDTSGDGTCALGNYSNAGGFEIFLSSRVLKWYFHDGSGAGYRITPTKDFVNYQWNHVALVRHNNIITLYINGESMGTYDATGKSVGHNGNNTFRIGCSGSTGPGSFWNGKISNFRVVKGQAVYTGGFIPSTVPLTTTSQGATASNVKLLCCNDTSVTGNTITPGTISAHNTPTASIKSPFPHPESMVFGADGDQNIVKTGSYYGSTQSAPEIYLGWEPQVIIFKEIGGTGNWSFFDNVRGINMPLEEKYLYPNLEAAEYTAERIEATPRGFRIDTSAGSLINTNDAQYVYIAFRMSDAAVGKPPEAGTDAFNVAYGTNTSAASGLPSFASTFKADMRLQKAYNTSASWYIGARQRNNRQLHTNTAASEVSGTYTDFRHSTGEGNNWDSSRIGYLWKRNAGFDVVSYYGTGIDNTQIQHNLGQNPEMIWIKNCTNAYDWMAWQKDLTAGNHLVLNNAGAQGTSNTPGLGTVSTTTFNIGSYGAVNHGTQEHVAYLFASVNGISKVDHYIGNGQTLSNGKYVNTGFQPRFIILKSIEGSGSWFVFDSLRGFGTPGSNTVSIMLETGSTSNGSTYVEPDATGFRVVDDSGQVNTNGSKYLYYAHA